MRAGLRGDPKMVQTLLDAGADMEARNTAHVGGGGGSHGVCVCVCMCQDGPTCAWRRQQLRIMLLLVPYMQGGGQLLLRRLLEAGKQCGSTALMMASEEGNPGVVRVLLAAGANKEAKDTVGGGGAHFVEV